jgi:hypothetical protein
MLSGLGTLTVNKSSWAPGQAGLLLVNLTFVCGGPAGQVCDTSTLLLDAVGSSGISYQRAFVPEIPPPAFGNYLTGHLYGGATETGNAGFLIDHAESSLKMRVQIFLAYDEFYFWIGAGPGG